MMILWCWATFKCIERKEKDAVGGRVQDLFVNFGAVLSWIGRFFSDTPEYPSLWKSSSIKFIMNWAIKNAGIFVSVVIMFSVGQ